MLKVRLAATLLVAASLSGCAAHETDRTTMAASADNSQLNPLGQANMEMKTLRPQAPSELTVTDVRIVSVCWAGPALGRWIRSGGPILHST